jgi:hypothetical protein
MSNTTFVDQTTVVEAEWLNDVNDTVYDILGNGTIIPATKAAARTNLGATSVGDAVFTAVSTDAAQTSLGGTTVGKGVFVAASVEAAKVVIEIPYQNYADNPGGPSGVIYQRTVAATADDVYFADRWYALTQTNTVTPSVISAPETGFSQGLRITQSQAVAQRYGFAQILPNDYVRQLMGGNVSLSFRARISNTTTLRWALLGWTGTADTVTSDVVNDWTSTTYTTGNFFITGAGSLSVIATGSQAMTANTFATLSTNAAAIGASINNLILFCWTDSTQAQNTTLDWHDVRLTKTDVRVPVEARSIGDERRICARRYFNNINGLGLGVQGFISQSNATAASLIYQVVTYPEPMDGTPVATKLGTWAVSNCGQPVVNSAKQSSFYLSSTATANGGAQTTNAAASAGYEVSSDL